MADDATVAALTFAGVGVLVAALGVYIRVRRRADLLANYDGTADPEYAAVHAGTVVALAGAFMVGFAGAQYYWRLPEWTVLVTALVVTSLAFVAAARAQGY
ncbi:hypothetical protein [Halobacterium wangiae]|uniref:hypothetical protein n=1 Tax=Halobacterium wangiae TaxID=2902623 RepID=UPI001E510253|nr:hypothetical protein [Halobacterium wangiae]